MKEKYYVTAPNIEHVHTIYNITSAIEKANEIHGEVWTDVIGGVECVYSYKQL